MLENLFAHKLYTSNDVSLYQSRHAKIGLLDPKYPMDE